MIQATFLTLACQENEMIGEGVGSFRSLLSPQQASHKALLDLAHPPSAFCWGKSGGGKRYGSQRTP